MTSPLASIALVGALVVGSAASIARADPVGFSLEEDPYELSTRQRVRRARAGLAMGTLGFFVGTLGIAAGVSAFASGSAQGEDVRTARVFAGTLLAVSPLVVGASAFGMTRSRRKLREVQPGPAGWQPASTKLDLGRRSFGDGSASEANRDHVGVSAFDLKDLGTNAPSLVGFENYAHLTWAGGKGERAVERVSSLAGTR